MDHQTEPQRKSNTNGKRQTVNINANEMRTKQKTFLISIMYFITSNMSLSCSWMNIIPNLKVDTHSSIFYRTIQPKAFKYYDNYWEHNSKGCQMVSKRTLQFFDYENVKYSPQIADKTHKNDSKRRQRWHYTKNSDRRKTASNDDGQIVRENS